MRIAFMGSACSGKSTLIEQFMRAWPQYKKSTTTYRDTIKEHGLSVNKQGNQANQKAILDALIREVDESIEEKEENVVFDRCVIDNIVYTLWLYNAKVVSQEFVIDCKYKVRKAVEKYDVIFYVPRSADIPLTPREGREIDETYIQEIDNIFAAVVSSYENGKDTFLPLENCPAVISLNGPPDLRCEMIRLYLKDDGSPFTEKDGSLIYD